MLPSTCADVVIGAGWSGVYFAYRRAIANPVAAENMCIFEATERVGGRTFSVPPATLGHEFTLDVGAYRFSPDMHLPGDLILHDLKLPVACYEPSCPSAKLDFPKPFMFNYTQPLVRIVDPKTSLPAGYATAIHGMLARLKPMGVRVFLGTPLRDILPPADRAARGEAATTLLTFANDTKVEATGTVMLNLPRNKLLALPALSASGSVPARTRKMLSCVKFDAPAKMFHNRSMDDATALTKGYLYYEDAWWHTKLNLTVGQFPHNAFEPLKTSKGIYIGVHWNDGPVMCTDENTGESFNPLSAAFTARRGPGSAMRAGVACHGYLQVYYAATNERFFYGASGAPSQPLGVVGDAPPHDHQQLKEAHAALLEAIAPLLTERGVAPTALKPPSQLAVGVWSRPGVIAHDHGYTAPTKVYWAPSVSGTLGRACGCDGLTEAEYRTTVLQPFGKAAPIYLANNDWVAQDVKYFYGDVRSLPSNRPAHQLGGRILLVPNHRSQTCALLISSLSLSQRSAVRSGLRSP